MSQAISLHPGARIGTRRNPLAGTIRVLRLMARNKTGFVGFLIAMTITIGSFITPIAIPFSPIGSTEMIYVTPSWAHLLGTDYEGRDVLVQVLRGGSDVVTVGFLAAFFTTLIAVPFGALSGFAGGRVDWTITGLADVVLTIPSLPLFIAISGLVSLSSAWQLAILIAVV